MGRQVVTINEIILGRLRLGLGNGNSNFPELEPIDIIMIVFNCYLSLRVTRLLVFDAVVVDWYIWG